MTLTIIFLLVYIAIVITIGIISARKESEEGFMIAERKVEGVQVAATMSAGFFDGATLSIYVAFLYLYGFSAIWLFVGIALGFLLVRKYAHKIKQKADELKVYTMPEYFFKILGKKIGFMFSFFLVLQFSLLLIVNLVISGKVLSAIFPIPYFVAVIIGGVIVLTYLLLAGFKAVVRTDFFQMIIMFVMSLSVGIFLFGKTNIPVSEFNLGTMGLGNIIGFLVLAGFGINEKTYSLFYGFLHSHCCNNRNFLSEYFSSRIFARKFKSRSFPNSFWIALLETERKSCFLEFDFRVY